MKGRLRAPVGGYFSGVILAVLCLAMRFLGYRTLAVCLRVPIPVEIALLVVAVVPFLLLSSWTSRKQGEELLKLLKWSRVTLRTS